MATTENVPLAPMPRTVIWLIMMTIHMVTPMDPDIQDLLTPSRQLGEACGYESCPIIKENMLNVHIMPHTHGELGYTRTFDEHYTGKDDFFATTKINMKRILDFTISELWAHNDRKFIFSDFPYLFQWWANRDGTVRRMVYQLLRQGRLHFVGGGWSMSDEATTSYHAIIDHFTYSLRKLNATFLGCGRPLVTWQSDAFGHSREFASLSAQMGFDGHFINPISFDDELARMRRKAMEFLWRGSDDLGMDTDIYTHKLFDGYWSPPGFCFGSLCNDSLIITSDTVFTNVEERVNTFMESMRARQAPHYCTRNVMVMMGRRLGYHDATIWFANIDKLINEVNKKSYSSGANMHLYYSTPACYLRAVHNANPSLEVKQDDFLPLAYDKHTHATGMYTSRPTLKYMAREGHVYLQIAKQLQVLARLWNNDKTFEELSWIVGVFQDHNIITGALRIHVKNYYIKKMYVAIQRTTLLIKQAFNKLRKSPLSMIYYRCSFNISQCLNTNSMRVYIVIYNPLAWPVTIPVRLPVAKALYTVYNPRLEKLNVTLMTIPMAVLQMSERNTAADHELVFMAEDIPPLGFRSYFMDTIRYIRPKRSPIKNINKNKNKKHLIRQTSNLKIDDESLLDNLPEDYYYFDETTTTKSDTNIASANVSKTEKSSTDFDYILTPKTAERPGTETPLTTASSTSKDDVYYQYDYDIKPGAAVTTENITTTTDKTRKSNVDNKQTIDIDKYMRDIGFSATLSQDMFVKNKYIQVNLDSSRKITNMMLSNGVNISLDIQYYFYVSDEPLKTGVNRKKEPGAYIFRPIDTKPEPIIDFIDTVVYKSGIVEEIHCRYADYASFVLRLYQERPYVEIDWLVGPLPKPKDVDFGRDIFIRYMTDLVNDGVFYTDSNGRQTMKRIRNIRATYDAVNMDPIPGNFYPVTSKIYIEDTNKNTRFSILNDRAQGGTSLHDGEIDLMIHRSITTDDSKIQAYINESDIAVRGKHYLYLSKADYRQNKIYEKILAKEIELVPQVLVSSPKNYDKEKWANEMNEYSGLSKKLPLGIHILTLQEWNDNALLLRLENYLEKCDVVKNGIKTVFLRDLFVNLSIKSVRETTLAGNIWLSDWAPLQWSKKGKFVTNFNKFYGSFNESSEYTEESTKTFEEVNLDESIVLTPQQIRTFVVWFDYVDIKIGNVL